MREFSLAGKQTGRDSKNPRISNGKINRRGKNKNGKMREVPVVRDAVHVTINYTPRNVI